MRPVISGAGAGRRHLMDKQSLVPAVQELWNAWEIHFLILLSLFLQVFLFLFGGMRRHCTKWYLRTILWLAYLSADSVAVFVLGHLAVRAREPGHQLMAFWAPFVLVHLGGQDSITAFSKQDNELWVRHLLNLVLQAGVAGYVVAKASWPNAWLMAAMVIMFVCGCFKYTERVSCLLSAHTKLLKLASHSNLRWRLKVGPRMRDYFPFFYRWGRSKGGTAPPSYDEEDGPQTLSTKLSQMEDTLDLMQKGRYANFGLVKSNRIIEEVIVVDAPLNLEHNIAVAADGDLLQGLLEGFLSRDSRHNAYEHVGSLLEKCYRRLYSKELWRVGWLFLLIPLSNALAASIALALFKVAVDKAGDQLHITSRVDVTVTYALLVGAIALDVSSAAILSFRHASFYFPRLANCIPSSRWLACCTKQWSQQLHQYNIINTAGMFSICQWVDRDVGSKHLTEEDRKSSIKGFILDTLLLSGTRKEWRIASTRGHQALHNWSVANQQSADPLIRTAALKSLEDTIRSSADFPTSVLILHIATDICYHYGGTNHSDHLDEAVKKHKQMSTEVSNYIMYLVFKCGVMLTTNSKIAHDNARDEIYQVLSRPPKFKSVLKPCGDQGNDKLVEVVAAAAAVMRLVEAGKEQQQDSKCEIKISHQESEEQQDSTLEIEMQESTNVDGDHHIKKLKMNSQALDSPVLPRAVAVAQDFMSIKNKAERWELIAKVWAEMLYYTAPRCGGDFHYEHLSRGGEFVTHVLLLMYNLGPFLPLPS